MGNWQLEVGRMTLYLLFPVGIFHYFNQQNNCEEWVMKVKDGFLTSAEKKEADKLTVFIEEFQRKMQLKKLKEMESSFQEGVK